ncbi:MAG: GNAT family N-acetyltransferase [Desulfobacteraceae bacterium]|nr:GNAT family N-acetyltransferase [Desulfobacteraceae bacterium]
MKHRLKPYLFSRGEYIFHDFLLKDHKRGWENPHGITFERFKSADYKCLENTLSDIDHWERLFTVEEVRARIDDGHRFYVAKKNDDIIGYFWLAVNSIGISFFNGTIHLKPGEALSFNALIKKEYRGKGIFNRLKAFAFNDLIQNGFHRVVGFYWHKNQASIRMNERFGSRIIGKVKYYHLLSLAFRWHNLAVDKIDFDGGVLIFWKKLIRKVFRKIKEATAAEG